MTDYQTLHLDTVISIAVVRLKVHINIFSESAPMPAIVIIDDAVTFCNMIPTVV